jgi:hypothetical protein
MPDNPEKRDLLAIPTGLTSQPQNVDRLIAAGQPGLTTSEPAHRFLADYPLRPPSPRRHQARRRQGRTGEFRTMTADARSGHLCQHRRSAMTIARTKWKRSYGKRSRDTAMRQTDFSLVVLIAVLGGCVGPMGPIRPDPPPPPAVTLFDGSYRTAIRLQSSFGAAATSAWCESPGQPMITIADGQFTYAVPHPNYPSQLVVAFVATMAQDGSFYGEAIQGSISGSIQGSRIEGLLDGSGCVYTFAGNRL